MPAPPPDSDSPRRLRWWLLLAVAAVVTLVAAPQAIRLRIETDLSQLLPSEGPATAAYLEYLQHFRGTDRIFIIVSRSDGLSTTDEVIASADDLVEELAGSELVDDARAGLTAEDQAFLLDELVPRLFLPSTEAERSRLERAFQPDAIRDRVRSMRARLDAPLTPPWQSKLFAADPFGLAEKLAKGVATTPIDVPIDGSTGRFLSKDGSAVLVIVTTTSHEMDGRTGRLIVEELDRAFSVVQERSVASLDFQAVGGPLYAVHEERAIRNDLTKTVTASAVAITLLLALYFGRSVAPLALALSIFIGLLWAAAVPVVVYGALSAVGISFGSILLGLGIDYGIHGVVSFERRTLQGDSADRGMRTAIEQVWPAIAASVATSSAGFLVLTGAGFAPLRELGVIVATGILLMAAAFFLISSPALVLWRRPRAATQTRSLGPAGSPIDHLVRLLTDGAARRPRPTLILVGALTLLAIAGWRDLGFSADLSSLRSADRPLQQAEEQLSRRFGLGNDTLAVVVEEADLDTALDSARQATAVIRENLPQSTINSPSDWLLDRRTTLRQLQAWPAHQDLLTAALETLKQAQGENGFAANAFDSGLRIMHSVASGQDPPPVPTGTWPSWLTDLVHRDGDVVQLAIHVRFAGDDVALGDVRHLSAELPQRVAGASLATINLVGDEMQAAAVGDLRRLGMWCALAVTVVVLLSFRCSLGATGLAILPVLIGCTWLLGFAAWTGVVLTPFAVMVLPVVIGIGVDDGLHIVHGRRVHSTLIRAAVVSGAAMTLTTMTTCLAFGTLALSGIPGLRQGGILVALGTIACLLVSLTVLPAIEALRKPQP